MAEGFRRLLSRSRSKSFTRARPQISEPFALEKGELQHSPLHFHASEYETTPVGASPVQGLLPLRGNRSYAVRRTSAELNPSRPATAGGNTTTTTNGSASRFRGHRYTKSFSLRSSRQTSPERVAQTDPVELPANSPRPKSEIVSPRRWSGLRPRSPRSSRPSTPGLDAPPVPPLPPKSPAPLTPNRNRLSGPDDRTKRASRQGSWERDGPNSLAAHPPFVENVASRYNSRRNSQNVGEEKRHSTVSQRQSESRPRSDAGYPHGNPPGAYAEQGGQTKPLEPAWYIKRSPKQRLPDDFMKDLHIVAPAHSFIESPEPSPATPTFVNFPLPPTHSATFPLPSTKPTTAPQFTQATSTSPAMQSNTVPATQLSATPPATISAAVPVSTESDTQPTSTEPTSTEPTSAPTSTEPTSAPTSTEPTSAPTSTEPTSAPTSTEPTSAPTSTESTTTPPATQATPTTAPKSLIVTASTELTTAPAATQSTTAAPIAELTASPTEAIFAPVTLSSTTPTQPNTAYPDSHTSTTVVPTESSKISMAQLETTSPTLSSVTDVKADQPRSERKRPRTRRSHVQRNNSEGGVGIQGIRRGSSSQSERNGSIGTETRATVAAALAAAAAPIKSSPPVGDHKVSRKPKELKIPSVQRQEERPLESPRDDASIVSWATADDGQQTPSWSDGPVRPADMLLSQPISRQDTPRAVKVTKNKELGSKSTLEEQTPKKDTVDNSADHTDVEDEFYPAEEYLSAEEVVRLAQSNSVDTTINETVALAVTHEVILPKVHNVSEEHITRDIHNHDVYHSVLPIIDKQTLPAKHFSVGKDGGLIEMQPEEVPDSNEGWVLLDTVSKEKMPLGTRHVTTQQLQALRSTQGP